MSNLEITNFEQPEHLKCSIDKYKLQKQQLEFSKRNSQISEQIDY